MALNKLKFNSLNVTPAASEGISLHHSCNYAVYLDRSFNAAQYLQSIDRIHRLGSTEEKNIILLQHKNTIDERVNKRLDAKIDRMEEVLHDKSIRPENISEDFQQIEQFDIDESNEDLYDNFISSEDIQALLEEDG